MSQLVREYTGRGPVQTRTNIQDDMVVVLMHSNLTKAEQTLADGGKVDLVLDRRRADQLAMGDAAKELIAELTGRPIVAFMSADHLAPDLALEFFLLEGSPTEAPV
jgi:uncharacterized protein YbcI